MQKLFLIISLSVILNACKKFDDEGAPDLTVSQYLSSRDLLPGGTIKEIIEIQNVTDGITTSPVVFTIANFPAGSGLSIKGNYNATDTIGTTVYYLSNADWDTASTAAGLNFTAKPGVIVGPSSSLVLGFTITRGIAPNQGADDTVTHTVTIPAGSGGDKTDFNNVSYVTLTKLKVPDLTPSQFFSSLQISPGGSIQELIQIRNRGTGPTTAPVSFTVTNYDPATGLTSASNNNSTVTIGIDTYSLTNVTDWNISVGNSIIIFTSKPGVVIPAGSSKYVGITITRAAVPNQGANGTVTHTITIAPGTGGGEMPFTNNITFNTIAKI